MKVKEVSSKTIGRCLNEITYDFFVDELPDSTLAVELAHTVYPHFPLRKLDLTDYGFRAVFEVDSSD